MPGSGCYENRENKKILQNGENINVEFKESKSKLNKDVFETVCAFLNRNGGELQSSQVHRCNGKIFDRNEDGDFEITNNTNLVAVMYMRKQSTYTENRIFHYAKLSDLKREIFIKVRKMAAN
ncbi:AlbA family DNA-binding domain-containing protein [Caloranaerobacter sp. DY30410]|uniref:AlbA family DNA-binding domain-containing protein n=1 Tax=Caloranaerobacter sp. DY30410 TaxID=3238305 RepID=UPI003CFC3202